MGSSWPCQFSVGTLSRGFLSPQVKTHLASKEGLPSFISCHSAAERTIPQLPTRAVSGKDRAPSRAAPVFSRHNLGVAVIKKCGRYQT